MTIFSPAKKSFSAHIEIEARGEESLFPSRRQLVPAAWTTLVAEFFFSPLESAVRATPAVDECAARRTDVISFLEQSLAGGAKLFAVRLSRRGGNRFFLGFAIFHRDEAHICYW